MKFLNVNKSFILYSIIIFTFFLPSSTLSGENLPVNPETSEKIINKIYEKYIPVYKKYSGVESTRNIDFIEYNPSTNTLINRFHISLIRKDYFSKKSEISILKYVKNDENMRTSEYQSRDIEPVHLVLDESGRSLYLTNITQIVTVLHHRCYQMQVVPKKKTPEHFEGSLYFRLDNLDLILIEGTLGEMPYSFKEYCMKQYIEHVHGLPVLKSGSCIMRIYIPVLQPDRRFVFSIKVVNNTILMD
jgi:hypothetical protein